MGAKPPIFEFMCKIRRTSDFGVLNIINYIFKTTQNPRFLSFCGGHKTSDFGVFAYSTQNLRFWRISNIINNILKLHKILLIIFSKLRKISDFGVFAVDAKPPILEFLRIICRTSDFGEFLILLIIFLKLRKILLIILLKLRKKSDFGVFLFNSRPINNIFKTMQNLWFWSFCGGRKTSDFGVFAYCRTYAKPPDFGILNIINYIFKTTQNLRFGSFCAKCAEPPILEYFYLIVGLLIKFSKLPKISDFGVFAVDAEPPILEFLRIIRRSSDFGILNIINNIIKTTQTIRFWSFCSGCKTSDFGVFAQNTQNLRFWSI